MLSIKRAKILSTRLYEFFEGGNINTIVTSPDKLVRRTNQATFSDLRKSEIHQAFGEFVVHTCIVAVLPQRFEKGGLTLSPFSPSSHHCSACPLYPRNRTFCVVMISARIYTLAARRPYVYDHAFQFNEADMLGIYFMTSESSTITTRLCMVPGRRRGDAHTSCSKHGNICRAFVLGLCPKWSEKIQTVLRRSLREVLPKVRIQKRMHHELSPQMRMN